MAKLPTQYPTIEVADNVLRPALHLVSQMFQRIAIAFNNPDNGETGERPTEQLVVGQQFFDTLLVKPIWWDGVTWVDATGTPV
jgi:hypothetical protein